MATFKTFHLKINTPDGVSLQDEILQFEIKTTKGYVGIMADHAPLIGRIEPCKCYIRDERNNRVAALINTGIFYFNDNELIIITNFFNFVTDVNQSVFAEYEKRINQALENARKNATNVRINQLQAKMQKQLADLKKIVNK